MTNYNEWINVKEQLPKRGDYLISFLVNLSNGQKESYRFFGSALFDPQIGWVIYNRAVSSKMFPHEYVNYDVKVTHYTELPNLCEE